MRHLAAIVAAATSLLLLPCKAADETGPAQKTESRSKFDPALYEGGNGLSRETAVILKSRSPAHGVPSEYAWIRHHYPDWKPIRQALTPWQDGKRFDVIIIRSPEGRETMLWFDISEMYK